MQIYVGYIVNSIRADYANSSLDELLCLYSLGKIHAYQLPDLSELLIDKGIESQYLVDLLISDDLNADEKTIIFQRAMNDVGYEIPDQRSAALRLSKNIAEKILSGDVSAYGKAHMGNYHLASSGDILADDVLVNLCYVTSSGSGDVYCFAYDLLNVTINGSGDVIFKGSPETVELDDNGSGDLIERN